MELKITQNIKPEDLLQGISWHGETDHDNEAVEKLKELNVFVSDLVAKIFFFQLQMDQVVTNQNNKSAKELSDEAKKLLENVVKMATEEENWEAIEKIVEGQKYTTKNIAQFKDWSKIEVDILHEIWEAVKKTDGVIVELKLSELKEKNIDEKDSEAWEKALSTLPEKIISLKYWRKWTDGLKGGVAPFSWVDIEPKNDRILVTRVGEMMLPSGLEKAITLDFLNEVMEKI
jgi:hypothetical protein